MTDIFGKKKRSSIMSKISGKNTQPEILVRKLLYKMGFRYRLHVRNLPGCPDIVLPKYKKIIFVHGCFWHGHKKCKRSKRPETNIRFWYKKLRRNIQRDIMIKDKLTAQGWDVLVVWQCQIKDTKSLEKTLNEFLIGDSSLSQSP